MGNETKTSIMSRNMCSYCIFYSFIFYFNLGMAEIENRCGEKKNSIRNEFFVL